ncbi:MAG: helix-turn-helix domain-containing protein [Oscillospiraceae bacterium]|jgi:predicted transcriptional regulator|nr:helix-turn-helix domain-containing protein [Oscillospiraceae bacterium]
MKQLHDYTQRQLNDPAFRAEYEALTPEFDIVRQIVQARAEQGLTQQELARRVGLPQSNISRLESGSYNPSLAFLKKVADGLGKELHVEFRPQA